MQWTIMVAGTVQLGMALPLLAAEKSQTSLERIAGLVAIVALVKLWHRTYRRQEVPVWAPVVEVGALLALALATGGLTSSSSIFYTNLYFRSLFGNRTRTAIGVLTSWGGTILITYSVARTPAVQELLSTDRHILTLSTMTLGAVVMYTVGRSLAHYERTVVRDRILSGLRRSLMDASTANDVNAAAKEAAVALLADLGVRDVEVSDAVKEPEVVVGAVTAGTPEAAGPSTVAVALSTSSGQAYVMTAVVDGPLTSLHRSGLEVLSDEVGLALDAADLAEQVRQAGAWFKSLVQHASDLVMVIGVDGQIRYTSPAIGRVLGYQEADMAGLNAFDHIHPEDVEASAPRWRALVESPDATEVFEVRCLHADGSWRWLEMLASNHINDPAVCGVVTNSRDVTERHTFEEELSHQAFHDSLTGLANRALFRESVRRETERRDGRPLAVLFIDLDDFKTVNDSLGHAAGDELLRIVGRRLSGCVRDVDVAARLGGDEFAVLLPDADQGVATMTADRIIATLVEPVVLQGQWVNVRASIGIASAGSGDDADELLRNADVAMYAAKASGKGRHTVFERRMGLNAVTRLGLESELHDALERGEMALAYQPIVDLTSGDVRGFEALVRWDHPTRGIVGPADFIGVAEETGQIVPLGRWVLNAACDQAASWLSPGGRQLTIAVNLSPRQLQHPLLVEDVQAALQRTGLQPEQLLLEVTETALLHDLETAAAVLDRLQALGVRVALDDFGTGYSSLSHLRTLPVDILKIDRSFISDSSQVGETRDLTVGLVQLAAALNLEVVAEGVETEEQRARVVRAGCGMAQGYYFAKPMAGADVPSFLELFNGLSHAAAMNVVRSSESQRPPLRS